MELWWSSSQNSIFIIAHQRQKIAIVDSDLGYSCTDGSLKHYVELQSVKSMPSPIYDY